MFLNFRFDGTEHAKLLEQALRSYEDGKNLKLSAMCGQTLKVSTSLKFFSPFLSEIIESINTFVIEEQTIILPDCSSTPIKHLINLLTLGCTQSCAALEDVAAIKEVAKMLRIDLKNLVYDNKINQSDLIKVEEELEDGEIKDDDEVPVGNKMRIAAFAKADMSIPNIVIIKNNNNEDSGQGEAENPEKAEDYKAQAILAIQKNREMLQAKFELIKKAEEKRMSALIQQKEGLQKSKHDLLVEQQKALVVKMKNGEGTAKPEGNASIMKLLNKQSSSVDRTREGIKTFLNASGLKNNASVKCLECKQSFAKEAGLTMHKKTSIKHKKIASSLGQWIECNNRDCNKMFRSQLELLSHIETHKRHSCEVCGKAFLHQRSLVKHMRIHTGEMPPIKCNLCGYTVEGTKDPRSFKGHMRKCKKERGC